MTWWAGGSDFVLQKTCVNVWRRSWLSRLGSRGRGQGAAKHHTAQDRPTTKDRLAPKASSAEAKKPGHTESFPLSRSSRQQGPTRRRHPNLFRRMNVVHFFISSPKPTAGAAFIVAPGTGVEKLFN